LSNATHAVQYQKKNEKNTAQYVAPYLLQLSETFVCRLPVCVPNTLFQIFCGTAIIQLV